MMPAMMENLVHLTQDLPVADAHLVVVLPGQPQDVFEVTKVSRQGTYLVLQCRPVEPGNEPGPLPRQDDFDHVFIRDDDAEPLSFHDPRRLYEDLR